MRDAYSNLVRCPLGKIPFGWLMGGWGDGWMDVWRHVWVVVMVHFLIMCWHNSHKTSYRYGTGL